MTNYYAINLNLTFKHNRYKLWCDCTFKHKCYVILESSIDQFIIYNYIHIAALTAALSNADFINISIYKISVLGISTAMRSWNCSFVFNSKQIYLWHAFLLFHLDCWIDREILLEINERINWDELIDRDNLSKIIQIQKKIIHEQEKMLK